MLIRRFFLSLLLASPFARAADAPPDYRFKVETLVEGMPQPMQLQIADDGRVFFIEIGGLLKVYKPATQEVVEAGKLDVTTAQENGLLGMALDPAFAQNSWIYLLRSPNNFNGQVLSRFTMQGDKLDAASEKELLRYEEQRRECCHHAGALRFGPDGSLYFSAGDNTNPFNSDGHSPHDEQPGREPWDAQKSSSNPNDLRGKIMRIKPTAEGGYTIPEGNLFPPGTPGTRPEIFVMGCRNPWRFNIDPKSGILYFGDVGPDAGGDNPTRGPKGFDEVNQVRAAGFFGWPYFIADNRPYTHYDFATKKVGEKFNVAAPMNNSPNNTGRKELPPAQPAWIFYPGGGSTEFPIMGTGGRTACAGPVFHWKPEFEKTGGFPQHFDQSLVIYDWSRPYMKWARMDGDSKLVGIEEFTKALSYKRPVDMVFGKDGALWMLEYGDTWGANKDAKLLRISYQSGNLAPIAVAKAKNASGREPLTVELSAEGSKDFEGEPLTYEWKVQPGSQVATGANAKFTIAEPGNYRVELRVSDPQGATGTASVGVMVGNTAPSVAFASPQNGDFFTPGQPIKYQVTARDAEDGEASAKPDEFGFRTLTSATWKTLDGKGNEAQPGFSLMKQSDCFNCHAVEQPLVGPPLLEVAKRYRGQAAAQNATVQRVILGSTGIWGQVGMLPHPQHTEDEVHLMVRWILALEPGKATPGMTRGLTGEIVAPKNDQTIGCVLEAVYTDAGRPPAAALSSTATVTLRNRRVEADLNDGLTGPTKLSSGGCTGKYCLGSIGDGHHVRFAGISLAEVGSITARASSGGSGGKIEFHAGSPTGELLGSVEIPNTGGWEKWVEQQTPVAPNAARQRADVFVVFANPGKSGLMNLDWVQFNPR